MLFIKKIYDFFVLHYFLISRTSIVFNSFHKIKTIIKLLSKLQQKQLFLLTTLSKYTSIVFQSLHLRKLIANLIKNYKVS